ncbi:Translationally-controlled tumor protein [Aspergillus pseudonomiae]|uniref:Translationally-controlled tumor protein homolog n=1 Tax=Aspergillus pseudonomiae TaxID=1506151 RepID=A0A5N7D877_9EURO|nr:Translationally-controlled tumor protein [Aspergillus pseudonomiae]KAB8265340.1 Translationally-controlled tumor protein [Aspergillus pseudonomiae]KAE8402457.1 Translationally-controlled tumor protein [Aspergillus pseudonomiae]
MSLFIDVISGDHLFSDDFPIKEVDDIVYEVDCKFIEVERARDVDIDANPSAEEEDDTIAKVNNVVHAFSLQGITFDKKTYRDYISRYIQRIKNHLEETDPDRAEAFERGAWQYGNKILSHFSSFDFYTGPSFHADGMVALLNYREDGDTPFFTFWKDGLQVADR